MRQKNVWYILALACAVAFGAYVYETGSPSHALLFAVGFIGAYIVIAVGRLLYPRHTDQSS